MSIDAAIEAIHNAMSETQSYLTFLGQGGEPSRETNAKLVYLWQVAGAELGDIDEYLSAQCARMAIRWSDPDSWSDVKSVGERTDYTSLRHALHRTQQLTQLFLNTHGAGDGGKD